MFFIHDEAVAQKNLKSDFKYILVSRPVNIKKELKKDDGNLSKETRNLPH